ncbi:MAG: DUF2142 domain-containing protein [Lachnospiraceae bacterium]
MFSMLLAWTPVTSNVINGVQGRYLLPLLPMFLLSLKNDRVVRTDWDDRPLLFVMAAMDLYVVLRLFSLVCLRVFADRSGAAACQSVDKVIELPDGCG